MLLIRAPGFYAALLLVMILASCTFSADEARPTPAPPPTATVAPTTVAGQPAVAFTTPPRPLELPRDDAPHRDPLEWWYYTGHLEADGGRSYGFEFAIFQRIAPDRQNSAGYVGHFAITDLSRNRFVYTEKLNLAPLPAEGGRGFDFRLDNWSMTGYNGDDRIAADLEGYRLELSLRTAKPPVGHGTTGYMASGTENSYYYSRTRMQASGTLTVDGAATPVRGLAWFDHQWGQMTFTGGGGWDWFAIMLEDGAELMVSLIRGADGKRILSYGTYVLPNGQAINIPEGELQVRNQGVWISPKSGGRYPMGWIVQIPRLGLDLTVATEFLNQELDTTASTGMIYWEGKTKVEGFNKDGPIKGMGYVELTGYVPPAGQR